MFDVMERQSVPQTKTQERLTAFAGDLEHLSACLFTLAERAPARMTIRQGLAFAIVAYSHAMGKTVTMKDLRELTEGVVGQSIEKTFQQFFTPSRDYPDGLGWVEQVPDEDDRRKKYLRLTPAGVDCTRTIIESLRQGTL